MNESRISDYHQIYIYLSQSSNWKIVNSNSKRYVFSRSNGETVFVPRNVEADDYADLCEIAIRKIAKSEGRAYRSVLESFQAADSIIIEVRRDSATSSINYESGISMIRGIFELIRSSATASVPRGPLKITGKRPFRISQFMQGVKMLPVMEGSFVVRASIPFSNASSEEKNQLFKSMSDETRTVLETFWNHSELAINTAQDVSSGSDLDLWDATLERGLSPRFCGALADLVGDDNDRGNVDISFLGSSELLNSPSIDSPIQVPHVLSDVLIAGADQLSGRPVTENSRLTGFVTRLKREPGQESGEVTVREVGQDDAISRRSIRCVLNEVDYQTAISAHESGSKIEIKGTIERTRNRIELKAIEFFHKSPD